MSPVRTNDRATNKLNELNRSDNTACTACTTYRVWVACLWIETIGIAVELARLPHLEGEPFVLAAADGIITAASNDAVKCGIAAGVTSQSARSLCPDLIVLPDDRAAYEAAARTVWDALATLSSVVEPVSPQLCYAQLRGTQSEVSDQLRHLTEGIAPRIGVPIRAGIARTKFVALRAAKQNGSDAKSDGNGALIIPLGEEATFLARLPLSSLPNHPKLDLKARQQMQRLGVKTLGDIWTLPPHRLPKSLQRIGHQLLQWAQGYDSAPIKPLWPPRTIHEAIRFEEETCDRFRIEAALRELAKEIACQLATGGEFAREVSLTVGLTDGSFLCETEKLALPQSQMSPLYRAALRLLQKFRIDRSITSLAIVAGEIGSGSGLQLSLMDQAGELPHERMKRLESALAFLRRRYGQRTVISGSLLRRARRIHLWTYALGSLLSEPLEQVATDHRGTPIRYWRRTKGRFLRQRSAEREVECYDVVSIHNRWRETRSRSGSLVDAEVWRVETNPFGVSELQYLQTEWRITAAWD